jgi:8-oxo-dGTP pyrophosphatase MutT (NUDIX family)
MIQFNNEAGKFVYRAAGVIVRGNQVLLHTWEDGEFWCVPGGRMEMHEPARECVRREIIEEMDLDPATDVQVGRLLWVTDNIYVHKGIPHHECGLYFEASLPADSHAMREDIFIGHEWDNTELTFQWFDLDELANVNLLPSFLRSALRSLPDCPEYILHTDE